MGGILGILAHGQYSVHIPPLGRPAPLRVHQTVFAKDAVITYGGVVSIFESITCQSSRRSTRKLKHKTLSLFSCQIQLVCIHVSLYSIVVLSIMRCHVSRTRLISHWHFTKYPVHHSKRPQRISLGTQFSFFFPRIQHNTYSILVSAANRRSSKNICPGRHHQGHRH